MIKRENMNATLLKLILLAALLEPSISAKAGSAFPAIIPLPDEWGPEGIAVEDILSADFKIPTTIAAFGDSIYAVNARFNLGNPPPPGTKFDIVSCWREFNRRCTQMDADSLRVFGVFGG